MRSVFPAACWLALAASGCGFVPRAKLTRLEDENRRLAEQTRAQLAEIENLRTHTRDVEDDLAEAELQLARIAQRFGIERRKLSNLLDERQRLRDSVLNGMPGGLPDGVDGELARLAERYSSLQYDPATGISKLDTDILFDTGEANLKPAAKQLLREFVAIIQRPGAEQLKVMVVGHTDDRRIRGPETRHMYPNNWHLSAARALAVGDEMEGLGLTGERMGVAAFGKHQSVAENESPESRQRNRRVEIFVMGPDVPVVGMTETLTRLY